MQFLGIRNWDKYQADDKGKVRGGPSPWVKDWTDKEADQSYMSLTAFQRYILDGCRRLRGRIGKNPPNDPMYIARALQVLPVERKFVGKALTAIIGKGLLVPTDVESVVSGSCAISVPVVCDTSASGVSVATTTESTKSPIREDKKRVDKEKKKIKSICPEPSSVLKAVMLLPLNNGDEFPIPEEDFEFWKKSYPAVDVMQELRAMGAWCHANPNRRKTKTGVKAFVNRWLAKAQNNPKAAQSFREGSNGQVSKSQQRHERNNAKYARLLGVLPEGVGGDLPLGDAGSGIGIVPRLTEQISFERSETGGPVIDGQPPGRLERNPEITGLHPPNPRAKGAISGGN